MANPQQKFGGDDDSSGQLPPEQPKKLDLKKYAIKPDTNIRDLFWDLMGAYATGKHFSTEDLKSFEHERLSLLRIALSVIDNPETAYYGLSRNFVARYSLMMAIDAGWGDVFSQLIIKSYEENNKPVQSVTVALQKIYEHQRYKDYIDNAFKGMMKDRLSMEAVLAYVASSKIKSLISSLKKEIIIIARGDIERNQANAMVALSNIKDDPEVKAVLISLIAHWDEETRKLALSLFKGDADPKLMEIAKRQLSLETNSDIKKMLQKITAKEIKVDTGGDSQNSG